MTRSAIRVGLTVALCVPIAILMGVGRIGDAYSAFGPHQRDTQVRDALFSLFVFTPAFLAIWFPVRGLLYLAAVLLALPALISLLLLIMPSVGIFCIVPFALWYWYFFETLKQHKSRNA